MSKLYHQNLVLRPYVNGNVLKYYWNGFSAEVGEPLLLAHPNDKGQNLMARMILASLKSHYVPFRTGFNPMN